jgi:hypothetical protein
MTAEQRANELRNLVAAHMERLQELTVRRNLLLHCAEHHPVPTVARALRTHRELADAVRRAARLARAQLAELEKACGCSDAPGDARPATDPGADLAAS